MTARKQPEASTEPRDARSGRAGDVELVRRSAAGDREAFRLLHQRYEAYVFWLALRIVDSAADAEDAAQEAWLRVHDRAGELADPAGFRGWLRTIAVRCCLDLRRRARRSADPGGAEPLPEELAACAGAAPTVRLDLERGIRTLPAEGRAVLVLHDIEGLAHAEVGALLSITEEASRTRLSRARRALREWLRSR